MAVKEFRVVADWDEEAGLWYVSDSDVPGLAAEAPTTEALVGKLHDLVPELVALNRHLIGEDVGPDLPVSVVTRRVEHIRAAE